MQTGRILPTLALVMAASACSGGIPTASTSDPNEALQGACGYAVRRGDTTMTVAAAGGRLTIPVRTTVGGAVACVWSVVVSDDARPFVTIVDPLDGQSSSTNAIVTLAVAANAVGQRVGHVAIAGVTFTITQEPATCSLSLGGDVNRTFGSGGGSGSVTITVTQGANCAWTAASGAPFVRITSPASGTGSATVTYSVDPNPGAARSATLTIAGQSVTVAQEALVAPAPSGCLFQVTPTAVSIGFSGATVVLVVTDEGGPACAWTVTSNAPFITVGNITHTSDTRSEVNVSIAPNSTPARTGNVVVANARTNVTVTITQDGGVPASACAFAVTPTTVSAAAAGTTGTLVVIDDGGSACSWDVVSNASFLSVGNIVHTSDTRSEVNFSVAPNGGAARIGTISILNPRMTVTVTVNQAGS